MSRKDPRGKGVFSKLRLPVAASYLWPVSRNRALAVALAVAALLLAVAVVGLWTADGPLANAPLSSAHATLEHDCQACHEPFGGVAAERCSACHERVGDELGVFTFAAHYLYRSGDFRRLVPSEHEGPCADCHLEHGGRDAAITEVADRRCLSCHDFGSFGRRHPEFELAGGAEERPGLAFAHVPHVREVMERHALVDVERACLGCHNPGAGGRGFEPISFDRHCDSCHLGAATATPRLAVLGDDGSLGVETLEQVQRRLGLAAPWAFATDPGELRRRGDRLQKMPLHHRDPWLLENLRRLRSRLYPDAGLADLLVASAEVAPHQERTLYREAVAGLEDLARGLRGRPEAAVQAELARVDAALAELERRLRDPFAAIDETRFALALEQPAADLAEGEAEAIEALVADLTEPCRQCHRVEKATFARVQDDQRGFRRAEFDHRAHVLQARCLDCHAAIEIETGGAAAGATTEASFAETAADRAAIVNLPAIEVCRRCHQPELASERCVTCHEFHPEKDRRADLLLYVDGGTP